MTYAFLLHVTLGQGQMPEDAEHILDATGFETRLDLAGGKWLLTLYSDAPTQQGAVEELLDVAERLRGVVVGARLDDDLVALSDIAARLDVTRQAVALFARPEDGFPQHVAIVASARIWRWAEVNEWLREHRPARADAERWPVAADAQWINALLLKAIGGRVRAGAQ